MKSGVAEADRVKIEGRQSLHRRKMAKNAPIVNGADESIGSLGYTTEEESMVRQVNLAAAFHDHISCTKSPDLCKVSDGKERVNLPCETDHIYANCSETKNNSHNFIGASSPSSVKDLNFECKKYRDMCIVHLDLIKKLQHENDLKDRQLFALKQEIESLKVRLERRDRRMCLLRKRYTKSDEESTDNISDVGSGVSDSNSPAALPPQQIESSCAPINTAHVRLATRYFGRRSKTIPLRALKRRYLGPPKILPKKSAAKSVSSAASISSSETRDEDPGVKINSLTMTKSYPIPEGEKTPNRKIRKKHENRTNISKDGFLTTDFAYYLPNCNVSPIVNSAKIIEIDVPSWKLKPVTSFYQMEGTENIEGEMFSRRHMKLETDERRRKRWDIQRLREQKITQAFKLKKSQEAGSESAASQQRKLQSFYPNSSNIEYIEVTENLPVLAFGHLIPLFQPSEFSLSWSIGENQTSESTDGSCNKAKKSRLSFSGSKVT